MSYRTSKFVWLILSVCALSSLVIAQGTEFTYQGQMQSGGTAASGNFDFEFALFDAAAGGSQVGSTLTRTSVAVTGGIFSVNLDFGQSFTGASRFLQIRVRPAGGGTFTTLSPRQPVGSSPYSIRSLSATNADNATTAANVSNPLAGDVTGSFSNSTVTRLRGRNVAANQPNNGQVLKFNSTTSQWEPANDETATSSGGGTITGVTAGTGLTGGGTTGSVTLAIANGGINTTQLADASVTDAKIVGVSGAKIAGTIPVAGVPAGSSNYIQNQQSVAQPSTNFNISGDGRAAGTLSANIVSASTQYNIGTDRILISPGSSNLFAGANAGTANTGGFNNSFFGAFAGRRNTTGGNNSFVGSSAGEENTTGSGNSFFGRNTGELNTIGNSNSFFGNTAGRGNTTGNSNSFFGNSAGTSNTMGVGNAFFGALAGLNSTTGDINAFFGLDAGVGNTTGAENAFFGGGAGENNLTGSGNTMLGRRAVPLSGGLTNATAIGYLAAVGQSNALILGAINGINGATFDTSVGIGTPEPMAKFHVLGNSRFTGNVIVTGTLNATLPAGSVNYIQNGQVTQANADFAISGGGSAATFSATQFAIQGQRVLSSPGTDNLFVGLRAGQANGSGSFNAFFGTNAGFANSTGSANSFFGDDAGDVNTTGTDNAFFGADAGGANTTGSNNAFFGRLAGGANTTAANNAFFGARAGNRNTASSNSFFGSASGEFNTSGTNNSFFGELAGNENTTGSSNSFFGTSSGRKNTTGSSNVFIGSSSGFDNTTGSFNTFVGAGTSTTNIGGSNNTFVGRQAGNINTGGNSNTAIGSRADFASSNLVNATAIGESTFVGQSNSLVLGRISGINGATTSTNIGIGTTTPNHRLTVGTGTNIGVSSADIAVFGTSGAFATVQDVTSSVQAFFGADASPSGGSLGSGIYGTSSNHGVIFRTGNTARMTLTHPDGNLGIGTTTPADKLHVVGDIRVGTGGANGCVKNNNGLAIAGTCSSDGRFKRSISYFSDVLPRFNQLKPAYYFWRYTEFPERGFGAEQAYGLIADDVEKVFPELVTLDEKGYRMVDYSRLPLLSIQAIKEQQTQIDLLTKYVCEKDKTAPFCKEEK